MILEQAYQLFLEDRETSCASKTLEYYSENLMNFFNYIQEQLGRPCDEIECTDITRQLFSNYIRYLRNRPKNDQHPFLKPSDDKLSATSIRTYARAIRSFSNFCRDNGWCESFTYKVKLPRDDAKEILPLFASEVEKLDACFDIQTEQGLRNWLIIHLMLDAGFRSSEVVNLRMCDLMLDKDILRISNSKGGKTRLVLLCPKLRECLVEYCTQYRDFDPQSRENVFRKMRGTEPINHNVIKQLFSRLKKRTGIERLHPHLLRHTFATSYICGGGNIEMLRLLLGHYSYDVTKMYLHLASQTFLLHNEIYRLDPIFFRKY